MSDGTKKSADGSDRLDEMVSHMCGTCDHWKKNERDGLFVCKELIGWVSCFEGLPAPCADFGCIKHSDFD